MIFWTLFSKNYPFSVNFDKTLILPKWGAHMNKICSKIGFKLNLGLVLFIYEDHWSKNSFLSKLSENCQFSLNKVQKITNNQNFFIKSKLLTICGFHIDFQFPAQKWLPRDFQRHLAHPWHLAWPSTRQGESGKSTNDFLGSL